MYFAMDEIGYENTQKIKSIDAESEKWKFIYGVAKDYGFEGIHFTPSLYKEFGLDLNNIPPYFQDFKLTFHFGGTYKIITQEDYDAFNMDLSKGFEIALKHKMHDISIHPPYIYGITPEERRQCRSLFDKAISQWTKTAKENEITLSLETHVSGAFFLFNGLEEYLSFVDGHTDLSILIDISHNFYDNYSEDRIIHLLGGKNVQALHISDALQNADFRKGTHLAIGDGAVNFEKILKHFDGVPNLFGALEIKSDVDGIRRSLRLLHNLFPE